MEHQIDIKEINFLLNLYGSLIATPNIDEETKVKCNKKIEQLLFLLDPLVDQVRKENSVIANLTL